MAFENGEQLSHARRQRRLLDLARLTQALFLVAMRASIYSAVRT